jgi:hypothetical protein
MRSGNWSWVNIQSAPIDIWIRWTFAKGSPEEPWFSVAVPLIRASWQGYIFRLALAAVSDVSN